MVGAEDHLEDVPVVIGDSNKDEAGGRTQATGAIRCSSQSSAATGLWVSNRAAVRANDHGNNHVSPHQRALLCCCLLLAHQLDPLNTHPMDH